MSKEPIVSNLVYTLHSLLWFIPKPFHRTVKRLTNQELAKVVFGEGDLHPIEAFCWTDKKMIDTKGSKTYYKL